MRDTGNGVSIPLILVADDDRDTRELLALTLKRAGYQVETVADGRQLIRRYADLSASGSRPAVVVTDIEMPNTNGLDAVEVLQLHEPVPTIFVTAHGSSEVADRARLLGMALLEKPLDLDHLRQALARCLMA